MVFTFTIDDSLVPLLRQLFNFRLSITQIMFIICIWYVDLTRKIHSIRRRWWWKVIGTIYEIDLKYQDVPLWPLIGTDRLHTKYRYTIDVLHISNTHTLGWWDAMCISTYTVLYEYHLGTNFIIRCVHSASTSRYDIHFDLHPSGWLDDD